MIDWNNAPAGATHYDPEDGVWYKRQQGYWDIFIVAKKGWRWATACGAFPKFESRLIPRPTEEIKAAQEGLLAEGARLMQQSVEEAEDKMYKKWASDNVNHPPHYQLREGYEVYDLRQDLARKAAQHDVPHDQYSDWDRALEYLIRMWGKNEIEDAKKARWYLNKLIEKLEQNK